MKALARRGVPGGEIDDLLALDQKRRELIARIESVRAEQRKTSKAVAGAATESEREQLIAEVRAKSSGLEADTAELADVVAQLKARLDRLPNVAEDEAPDGDSEEDNVEIRRWGDPPSFDFEPKDHVELGEALGMLDIERGVRTSGARFAYLTGPSVRIQLALIRYGLDFAQAKGFLPVVTPVLVREEAMYGTGFFPTDEAQVYATRDDDLYLAGTAEVPLASFHKGEILDPDSLPRRYAGYSTCFRREAGTYGKDTRGIFRVHQFDKLEMFSFAMPEESRDEHARFLGWEEEFYRSMGIAYRVVDTCTADLGAPYARKFDIEAWMPGQGKYREITSTSNATDYQARRLECRVRLPDGNRPVHTVNGTLCAIGRTLIALLENGQRADGSVELPEVLRTYLAEADWVLEPLANR